MRTRGFSLLELLVVMAIIAVVMAIFIPPLYHFVQYVRHMAG